MAHVTKQYLSIPAMSDQSEFNYQFLTGREMVQVTPLRRTLASSP